MQGERKQDIDKLVAPYDREEGEWDDVIERHFEYLSYYPKSSSTYYNLGFTFAERGQVNNAHIAFEKSLEVDPNMAESLVNLGGLAFGQQEWEKSIEYNEKALEIRPKMLPARLNIGFANLMKGDIPAAVEIFDAILKKYPKEASALYGMAVAYDDLKDEKKSLEYFDRAVTFGAKPDAAFAKKMKALKKALEAD